MGGYGWVGFGCESFAFSLFFRFFLSSLLYPPENPTLIFHSFGPQVMERTERERTLLRSDNAKLRREVDLWKMKAQVAESGQQMDRHRRSEGISLGGEGEGDEEIGGSL